MKNQDKTLDQLKAQDAKNRLDREARIREHWENLKEIKEPVDVPHLPNPLTEFHYDKLYKAGVLRKEELEDGATYVGECRNADKAVWHEYKNCFTYVRHKMGGYFKEDINHLADDNGFDLFVPLRKL